MKKIFAILVCLSLVIVVSAQEKKLIHGFDGGMMVHTGYLSGHLDAIGYDVKGMPVGIGGVARLHVGKHFRVGGEGYISNLSQLGNGGRCLHGTGPMATLCRPYIGRRCHDNPPDDGEPFIGLGAHRRNLLPQAGLHGHRPVYRMRFHRFRADAPYPKAGLPLCHKQVHAASSRPEGLYRISFLSLSISYE